MTKVSKPSICHLTPLAANQKQVSSVIVVARGLHLSSQTNFHITVKTLKSLFQKKNYESTEFPPKY